MSLAWGQVPGAVPAQPGGAPPPGAGPILRQVSAERLKADVARLESFGTRHTLSDATSETRGIGTARRWIKSQFDAAAAESGRSGDEAPVVRFDGYPQAPDGNRITKQVEIVNVVMELPGRLGPAAGRTYIVGHYDSRNGDPLDFDRDAPGANDDASGTAVVIELARVLSKHRFDSTLVFMATAGEEQGLLGARNHARQASEAGVAIRGVLSNDIVGDPSSPVGAEDRERIRVFSEGLGAAAFPTGGGRTGATRDGSGLLLERLRREGLLGESSSRELARFIAMVGAWERTEVQPAIVFRSDRFLRGGDHTPFHEAGYPAVRFTEMEEDYSRQHQDVKQVDGAPYGDVSKYVDAPYLAGVARLNGAAAIHLASAPAAPAEVNLITTLGNESRLRWIAGPEPDIAGYEIVWRETTSPVWQLAKDVGKTTEATLPINKDNVFFGVRAYDAEGFRSPATIALAARE